MQVRIEFSAHHICDDNAQVHDAVRLYLLASLEISAHTIRVVFRFGVEFDCFIRQADNPSLWDTGFGIERNLVSAVKSSSRIGFCVLVMNTRG
jgi:hypothetical protein